MKYYNVTLEIQRIGRKVVTMSELRLQEALSAWKNKRSVNIPTVGLIRGRSITKFSYEQIIEEEVKEDG